VSRTPLGNRSNTAAPPSAPSSEETCRDTADCVHPNSRAATVNEPCRATSRNTRSQTVERPGAVSFGELPCGMGMSAMLDIRLSHHRAGPSVDAMRITLDDPASAPQPLSPYYSQVARVEHADGSALLYLSGQIAEGATLAEQSRGVFETIAALLEAHGATLADVINIRTYLTDITALAEYGAVRREFLTGTPPTSMTFEVSRLFRAEALIEVEVVAAVPGTE
jgi:2-iminobutanoate/2-iminopropanoate deaminase